MSVPIWSARCHPIYQLIEVTDEAQMLCLKPGIRNLVKRKTVISQSRYLNQNQGLDAVLEEINKTLKLMVSPVHLQQNLLLNHPDSGFS